MYLHVLLTLASIISCFVIMAATCGSDVVRKMCIIEALCIFAIIVHHVWKKISHYVITLATFATILTSFALSYVLGEVTFFIMSSIMILAMFVFDCNTFVGGVMSIMYITLAILLALVPLVQFATYDENKLDILKKTIMVEALAMAFIFARYQKTVNDKIVTSYESKIAKYNNALRHEINNSVHGISGLASMPIETHINYCGDIIMLCNDITNILSGIADVPHIPLETEPKVAAYDVVKMVKFCVDIAMKDDVAVKVESAYPIIVNGNENIVKRVLIHLLNMCDSKGNTIIKIYGDANCVNICTLSPERYLRKNTEMVNFCSNLLSESGGSFEMMVVSGNYVANISLRNVETYVGKHIANIKTGKHDETTNQLSFMKPFADIETGTYGETSNKLSFAKPFADIETGTYGETSNKLSFAKPFVPVQPARDTTNLKILVVDDSVTNLKLCLRMVNSLHFGTVHTAVNGKQLVEMHYQNKYDVILTDINMPVMNGDDAIKNVRKNDTTVFIIACSGNCTSEDIQHYIECGANKVLAKPFSADMLKKSMDFIYS